MRCFMLLVAAAGLIIAADLRADDWPEFRGPDGQGHVKGSLPTEWGPKKNVTWKQALPGNGWSSPVIWKDRVYVTAAVGKFAPGKTPGKKIGSQTVGKTGGTKDLSLRALCLDAKTGRIVWDAEAIQHAQAPSINDKNTDATPTPIVDGKQLYLHFGHLGTACLDLDGKVVWRNTEMPYDSLHGSGGSPILVDDLLIYSIDGIDKQFMVALETATGKVKWKTDRKSKAKGFEKISYSTPLLIDVKGQKQIVSAGGDMAAAYDPKTGEELWRIRYTGYSVVGRPVFGNGMVYITTGWTPSLIAIRPEGKGDVTATNLAWTVKKNVPQVSSPVLDGDILYMVSDSGIVSCLDAKSGKLHSTLRLEGTHSSSPVLADGKLYFTNEEGTTFVVKAGANAELLARNEISERTQASFAGVDGVIYLRTASHLYRIEKR